MENTCTGAQLAGKVGRFPCPFLKKEKQCPDFAKEKCLDFGKKISFLCASIGSILI